MATIYDLDNCKVIDAIGYGGAAGRKVAIDIYGQLWMVKFPVSTANFPGKRKHLPSYTTAPLSEYIGSHIYETLNIPVHETMLGKLDDKIVVACKDFSVGKRLQDFASAKNMVSEENLSHGTSSNSKGEYLSEAIRTVQATPMFNGFRDDAFKRFWDMFVVDAFIANNDRNNGNWGVLLENGVASLAPVFDNGQSFFNKKSPSVMGRALEHENDVWNNMKTFVSFYTDDSGKGIHPFDYLGETDDEKCIAALERFIGKVDYEAVAQVIDDIPEEAFGLTVMPDVVKRFYKESARLSLAKGLVPASLDQGISVPDRLLSQLGLDGHSHNETFTECFSAKEKRIRAGLAQRSKSMHIPEESRSRKDKSE